ncbi:MAG: histidine--tRNA ligase [Candidatus Pacebacteria bacterium]|nr:histidine--tRNA ligase [Candidatus Paceibacterota bacterium]
MKGNLPTEPYKGVRDFYPRDMFIERYIFDTMSRVVESFGYQEYGASILESGDLYRSKSSEEIVSEQTYTFTDRGEREVTLRPEMTPTLARMVAGKRQELPFPLRWYSIPNVFRYERPQRGRMREHWQLNADLFGVEGVDAEAEIILLAHNLMKAFGADEGDFEIRINDREILSSLFTQHSISEGEQSQVMRLLDKKEKIDDFNTQLTAILGDRAESFDTALSQTSSSPHLESLLKKLAALGVANATVNTSVVRGFQYYTGIVFEVFDASPENNRSLFGGGRYDNLLEVFGVEKTPAVGFGMGDITIRDFLETHELLPEYTSRTDLYLCTLSPEAAEFAQKFAAQLRAEDINVEVSLSQKKVGDQIKVADKKEIPFVIVIGEEEIISDSVAVKHLESGEQETVKKDAVADFIFSKI